jgi:hypothetical protein
VAVARGTFDRGALAAGLATPDAAPPPAAAPPQGLFLWDVRYPTSAEA